MEDSRIGLRLTIYHSPVRRNPTHFMPRLLPYHLDKCTTCDAPVDSFSCQISEPGVRSAEVYFLIS